MAAKSWQSRTSHPENVNFNKAPAAWLTDVYKQAHNGRPYEKVVDGIRLFTGLRAEIAREKCPYLKLMLDEMLDMARAAGQ